MNEDKKFAFPCIGLAKDGSFYTVAVQCNELCFIVSPDVAEFIAADLLLWANRVAQLNDRESNE